MPLAFQACMQASSRHPGRKRVALLKWLRFAKRLVSHECTRIDTNKAREIVFLRGEERGKAGGVGT
jgi:hypothetical protein